METLAAGVRHRRDSGGPVVDQQRQGLRSCGARSGQVITTAVRSPVRPATRGMRVVSTASAKVIAGRMVVSHRASLDVLASRALAWGVEATGPSAYQRYWCGPKSAS
jgi:hypothetical protein